MIVHYNAANKYATSTTLLNILKRKNKNILSFFYLCKKSYYSILRVYCDYAIRV